MILKNKNFNNQIDMIIVVFIDQKKKTSNSAYNNNGGYPAIKKVPGYFIADVSSPSRNILFMIYNLLSLTNQHAEYRQTQP